MGTCSAWHRARVDDADVCRKAVATHLEEAEDIEAASEQLGHSSSRITSRSYAPAKIDRSDFSSHLDALVGGAHAS